MSDTPYSVGGVDPGFEGAIARITVLGGECQVWPMPVHAAEKDRQREFDIHRIRDLFMNFRLVPGFFMGIEWPTTRPEEGAERSERFGRGKGYLEAIAFCTGIGYTKIAPNLWKGRLGVPGKDNPDANRIGAQLFDTMYPTYKQLIRGPRGGILSGPLDALLIAHFLRTQTHSGNKSIVERFGKDSDAAALLVLGGGRSRIKISRRRS